MKYYYINETYSVQNIFVDRSRINAQTSGQILKRIKRGSTISKRFRKGTAAAPNFRYNRIQLEGKRYPHMHGLSFHEHAERFPARSISVCLIICKNRRDSE